MTSKIVRRMKNIVRTLKLLPTRIDNIQISIDESELLEISKNISPDIAEVLESINDARYIIDRSKELTIEWVFEELQKEFLKKEQKEWFEIFKSLDVCIMPVKNFAEACEDPQIKARNMVIEMDHPSFGKIQNIGSPIKYSRTPLKIRNLAPKVGQNAGEILRSLNYNEQDLREFKRKGII